MQELTQAVELLSTGVGHLENKEWPEAEAQLTQLAQLLPGNRVAARNLAIERVLIILDRESPFSRSGDPARYSAAVESARAAIQDLRQASPEDAPLADLMLGQLLIHDDSPEQSSVHEGIALLKQAAAASGDRPDYWFQVALAMAGHREYADSVELIETLQRCFQLEPENLFVLRTLLERQAIGLNARDPKTREAATGLVDTLKAARVLIEPINDSIVQQRRINLIENIDQALAAFDGSNWNVLTGRANETKNLLAPELATHVDQRRIDRNLLEFVLTEFEPPLSDQIRDVGMLPQITATVLQAFTEQPGLPALNKVTQLQFADLNLNGSDDLVAIVDGHIQVYGRSSGSSTDWSLMMETSADSGRFSRFLLTDLDRDFDRALSNIKVPVKLLDRDGDRKIVTDPAGQHRWYDTDLDLVAWNEQRVTLFRNDVDGDGDGDGRRTLTLLSHIDLNATIHDLIPADLEADGDLDLIAATSAGMTVLRNLDGTQFEIVSEYLSPPDYAIHGLVAADWNRDVAMDVIGVSTSGAAGTLQNMRHNRFRWLTGVDGLSEVPSAVSVRVGDFDGNLSWDLATAGPSGIHVILTSRSPDGAMTFLKKHTITTTPSTRLELVELDNDGYIDIVALTESGMQVFRGHPDGTFQDLTDLLPGSRSAAEFATVDIDEDGDIDLVVVDPQTGTPVIWQNNGGNTNGWLDVVARAVGDDAQFPTQRVNMHAIGAVLELRAGTAYQAHIIDQPRMHLGMGQAEQADAIRVIWTDGVPQGVIIEGLLNARIGILQPQILNGSCPYIYTWTGERFEFFSDCLWAAPIGLVQANGDIAPTREWEYLLIPGEQLVAKEGRYVLQLTEELWEATYFDEVELVAVDHPADVSIFTNEKVGSPEMAEHRIHTVRKPHLPASVVNGRGQDLLPGLTAQDADYVQAFEQRIVQGLTDEWVMEFDPGLSDRPKNLRLVLIGWVFPTNTSLNVGIAQNPQLAPPAPPSIEVRNADGEWQTALPFIGFPGGKTKAMVVDLSDVFLTDDLRFRLKSSMELYWDAAFFIVDEEDVAVNSQDCPLVSASLQYRGFSRRTYADNALFRQGRAPEGYDYDSVTTTPRWPTMLGRFTRYGDTTALIEQADDQLVVMGPGDELTLQFEVPPSDPPNGWKRDFVLYNVGWDKDADLNTIYGQSSEPYPFRAMPQYPLSPDEAKPESAEYQRYLKEWQTREFSDREFQRAVRGK